MSTKKSFCKSVRHISLLAALALLGSGQALADEGGKAGCRIEWSKLNLTAQQSQQIDQLDQQWQQDFRSLKPLIDEAQRKKQRLLESHNADPLEIMRLQASIDQWKQQLNQAATANYLKKRQILNESQQHQLEQMLREKFEAKQRELHPGINTEPLPSRMQGLIQRVKNIWAPASNSP
ncbi:MAG TPA: hypothetical protein V6D17_19940 [Candidatus Obscuribacterales bacterium]